MEALEKLIVTKGHILEGDILKVDSFLNHQIDTAFLPEIGKEFKRRFADCEVNKILTIEASGIAIGCATSQFFNYCPVVFAKKGNARNIGNDTYHVTEHSYTRNADITVSVSRQYLSKEDKVLILDDFLANGEALNALISIARQAGCQIAGCGVVIEKAYQQGGDRIREQGIRVESLARIKSMSTESGIEFCQ